MDFIREVAVLLEKEILLEKKQKTVVGLGMFFAFLLVFVFSIIFMDTSVDLRLVSGLLWIAVTFTVILVVNRSLYVDQENNCIEALFMSPISKHAVFWGKCLAIFIMLAVLQFFMAIVFIVFFQVILQANALGKLIFTQLLGTFAMSNITILVAMMISKIKGGEILLPVILLPLLIPLIISLVETTSLILGGNGNEGQLGQWMRLIVFYSAAVIIVPSLFLDNITNE
ncbi:heme exporter protein CcmB [Desulfitibacter alkalitolerans]|uniref:heme exporter protein CcmB n=1 Tax=Desulfitibacter alkalitolerans TaxID=264641 RepID=UPI000487337F|nr:heme exporter protein CcmB [Desulfitibacter alkalitolerans]